MKLEICNYMNKNDVLGFFAYFLIGLVLGYAVSFICLIIHENTDRCYYYNGKWSYKDLSIGIIAILLSYVIKKFVL